MSAARTEIDAALNDFARDDAGRSVALQALTPLAFTIGRRADLLRPAASTIKLAMAMALYRKARDGHADLDAKVPVKSFGKTRYVSLLAGFDPDHALSLREICRFTLIGSDNPLTVYLQQQVTFDEVTALLRSLDGGADSVMAAGFGEEELGPRNRANLMTANAALSLLTELERDALYADLVVALENNLRNNRIPARLPENAIVAHKTGSLNNVVNDIGRVRDGGVAFRIAFLTDAQADADATALDIARCTARIYDALRV